MRAVDIKITSFVSLISIIMILSNINIIITSSASSDSNPTSISRGSNFDEIWASAKIWADDEQLKDVAVGDIDPNHDGTAMSTRTTKATKSRMSGGPVRSQ
jgi:hypothetical protein